MTSCDVLIPLQQPQRNEDGRLPMLRPLGAFKWSKDQQSPLNRLFAKPSNLSLRTAVFIHRTTMRRIDRRGFHRELNGNEYCKVVSVVNSSRLLCACWKNACVWMAGACLMSDWYECSDGEPYYDGLRWRIGNTRYASVLLSIRRVWRILCCVCNNL